MIEKLKKTIIEFSEKQDLTSWFNHFAVTTWHRIEFARLRERLRIYETTVTQNLLYEMAILLEATDFPLRMYESLSEKTNGDDLEIVIKTDKGYVIFPCQAKIIYPHDRYYKIDHVVGERHQIDLLIEYAKRKQGVPIYFLYNYCSNGKWYEEIQNQIDFDIELYGCSIANANTIKRKFCELDKSNRNYLKWQIPSFKDLHPHLTQPIGVLGDFSNKHLSPGDLIKRIAKTEEDEEVRLYSREEILEDYQWEELVPITPSIGKLAQERSNRRNWQEDKEGFSPKFRLMIEYEKPIRGTTIYYMS